MHPLTSKSKAGETRCDSWQIEIGHLVTELGEGKGIGSDTISIKEHSLFRATASDALNHRLTDLIALATTMIRSEVINVAVGFLVKASYFIRCLWQGGAPSGGHTSARLL